MLKDLAGAVEVLTPKAVNNVKVMSDYDLVFNGDVTKWVKSVSYTHLQYRRLLSSTLLEKGNIIVFLMLSYLFMYQDFVLV